MFGNKKLKAQRDEWRARCEYWYQKAQASALRLSAVIPPQDNATLIKNLEGQKTHPIFQAILNLVIRNEELAKLNAAEPKQGDIKPGFYDGALASAMQIQEDILYYEDKDRDGNAKPGRKPTHELAA